MVKLLTLALFSAALCATPVSAKARVYRVVADESRFDIHVGRSGLFKMFGHDHIIRVRSFTGDVDWDAADPGRSRFELDVDAASLLVADDALSDDDRAQVQDTMEREALALSEYNTISFVSTQVEPKGDNRIEIRGELDLRGVRRELAIPATVTVDGERLVVRGELELKSGEWGVPQISALGGSVKTRDELGAEFEIVAMRQ